MDWELEDTYLTLLSSNTRSVQGKTVVSWETYKHIFRKDINFP